MLDIKKKEQKELEEIKRNLPIDKLDVLEDDYYNKLETDPKYSIVVDPENKYNMSDTQKEFIANYIEFKNVPLAAKLTDIDEETAKSYFSMYSTKMEIRRINIAMYHRTFATRMLSLDEVGGYLTSLIIGENIAEAEKISTRDKMQAAKMIVEINRMKQEAFVNSNVIDYNDIQDQFSDLSVDTIKAMLNTSKNRSKANEAQAEQAEIIDEFKENNPFLTNEEITQLKTMPTKDLVNLLEETNEKLGLTDKLNAIKNKAKSKHIKEEAKEPEGNSGDGEGNDDK